MAMGGDELTNSPVPPLAVQAGSREDVIVIEDISQEERTEASIFDHGGTFNPGFHF